MEEDEKGGNPLEVISRSDSKSKDQDTKKANKTRKHIWNKLAKLRRHASRVHFAKIYFGRIHFGKLLKFGQNLVKMLKFGQHFEIWSKF